MNTVKFEAANKPLMVAHRGSCSLEIENTAAAFVAAANRSYFAVECDVMKTVDGKYIVCHNNDTAYVAGDRLTIAESSFDTLRSLKLFNLTQSGKVKDRNDLRLATMEEYIMICKNYEKHAFLEIKFSATEDDLREICETIRSYDYLEHVTFLGNAPELIKLRTLYPEQSAQLLGWELTDEFLDTMVKYHLDFGVSHKKLTKEQVDLMHSKGIKVNVWTVDDKDLAEELAAWGVDFISSNILE